MFRRARRRESAPKIFEMSKLLNNKMESNELVIKIGEVCEGHKFESVKAAIEEISELLY